MRVVTARWRGSGCEGLELELSFKGEWYWLVGAELEGGGDEVGVFAGGKGLGMVPAA